MDNGSGRVNLLFPTQEAAFTAGGYVFHFPPLDSGYFEGSKAHLRDKSMPAICECPWRMLLALSTANAPRSAGDRASSYRPAVLVISRSSRE